MAKKKKQHDAPGPEVSTEVTGETVTAGTDGQEETAADVDPLEQLNQELAATKDQASKNWDLYLRERADMENLRKRHQRDKEDAIRFANDRLLKEMIPVLDNLERAVEHAEQDENNDNQGLIEGVHMTINQFRKVLEEFGVKPVNALGEAFDPNVHQAMGHIETAEQPPNTVVNEFQKGYLLNDRLLRPSLVMVAKAPSAAAEQENNGE